MRFKLVLRKKKRRRRQKRKKQLGKVGKTSLKNFFTGDWDNL